MPRFQPLARCPGLQSEGKSPHRPLGLSIQHELKRQLSWNKDRKHRSYAWKVLRAIKEVFQATKYQGDTALTIPPFFKNAGRGNEKIWGERISTPQPIVINWSGLDGEEKQQLIPTLSTTENWILLTQILGESNRTQPPFREAKLVARFNRKNSRHKGWC